MAKKESKLAIVLSFFLVIMLSSFVSSYNLSYDLTKNELAMNYDDNNRILNQSGPAQWISYSYDGQVNNTLANITTSQGVFIKYQYDNRSRITKETKEIDGFVFEKKIDYDSLDRITSLKGTQRNINFQYGENKLIKSIGSIVNVSYNERGQPIVKLFGNDLETVFRYNLLNYRLLGIETENLQNLTYAYDSVGNIILINDTTNSRQSTMSYDYLNRLIFANINGSEFNYSYNSIGNLLNITGRQKLDFYYGASPVHAPNALIEPPPGPYEGLNISWLSIIYQNTTERVFGFTVENMLDVPINNISWMLEMGEINESSQYNVTINDGEELFVNVYHNYTLGGNYTIIAHAQNEYYLTNKSINIEV